MWSMRQSSEVFVKGGDFVGAWDDSFRGESYETGDGREEDHEEDVYEEFQRISCDAGHIKHL